MKKELFKKQVGSTGYLFLCSLLTLGSLGSYASSREGEDLPQSRTARYLAPDQATVQGEVDTHNVCSDRGIEDLIRLANATAASAAPHQDQYIALAQSNVKSGAVIRELNVGSKAGITVSQAIALERQAAEEKRGRTLGTSSSPREDALYKEVNQYYAGRRK